MTYQEAVKYLYNATPQFQLIGAGAYKPGLQTILRLSNVYGNPQTKYPIIHVGGTNGKGSTSHSLAAVLQAAGYKVGLYTSPHLIDFRERIRINGKKIPEDTVALWIEEYIKSDLGLQPSFFELTTMMAFDYFATQHVDIAVIEVGLGGRLDSTNILTPILSIITNISLDHTAQLGHTLHSIAFEKAGIIKNGIQIVIGESRDNEVKNVFTEVAFKNNAPIQFADQTQLFEKFILPEKIGEPLKLLNTPFGDIDFELGGDYQVANANTILHTLLHLRKSGWEIKDNAIKYGLRNITSLTGLAGRWMVYSSSPLIICDTGHNIGGWKYISQSLQKYEKNLKMIIGFVNDKDIDSILEIMPQKAQYYFTKASVPRALDPKNLAQKAREKGINGICYESVESALKSAISESKENDMIFVGGSTFVVADLLAIKRDH